MNDFCACLVGLLVRDNASIVARFSGLALTRGSRPELYDVALIGLLMRGSVDRCSVLGARTSTRGSRPRAIRCRPYRQRREGFFALRRERGTSVLFRAELYSKVIAPAYQGLAPWLLTLDPIRGPTRSRLPTFRSKSVLGGSRPELYDVALIGLLMRGGVDRCSVLGARTPSYTMSPLSATP